MIVTHNSARVIGDCLEALSKMAPGITAIVVDNASSDASVQRAREGGAQVIANAENRGFAAAVNQGFKAAQAAGGFRSTRAEFVLLLNPDVTLLTPVDALLEAAQSHGLAAGQLTEPDGSPQAGFTIRRLPTPMGLIFEGLGINWLWRNNPVNRRYLYLDRDLNEAGPVEQPAGAFLMIRRDVWENLGGFDEGFYPIWFEDVDFCRRALDFGRDLDNKAGYRIQYVPSVKASHEGGHSIRQMAPGCRGRYWYGSLLRYAGKHFKPSAYRAVWLAAVLGALPRAAAGIMQERRLRPASSVVDIFRFRVQRDRSPDRPPGTRRSG